MTAARSLYCRMWLAGRVIWKKSAGASDTGPGPSISYHSWCRFTPSLIRTSPRHPPPRLANDWDQNNGSTPISTSGKKDQRQGNARTMPANKQIIGIARVCLRLTTVSKLMQPRTRSTTEYASQVPSEQCSSFESGLDNYP